MTLINGEQIRNLEEQNAALAAQVEALREAWKAVKRNDWDAPLDEAFEKTPQHHLRQVRADAVFEFVKTIPYENVRVSNSINQAANQYAASILAGKE